MNDGNDYLESDRQYVAMKEYDDDYPDDAYDDLGCGDPFCPSCGSTHPEDSYDDNLETDDGEFPDW